MVYSKYLTEVAPPYALFAVKGDGFSIVAYNSKKVVFQGPKAYEEAKMWGYEGDMVLAKKVTKSSKAMLTSIGEHIGSDEVGTGDFFGPIITTACFVPMDSIPKLKALGVDDSKKINDKVIMDIYKDVFNLTISETKILTNTQYNRVIMDINMNAIKAKMHNSAIRSLLNKLHDKSPRIIVDQFVDRKNYFKYLQNEEDVITNIWLETKAESKYIGVACASIIARYNFLTKMKEMSEFLGAKVPLGAGVNVDKFIDSVDKEILNKVAKLNFKNYTKRGNN